MRSEGGGSLRTNAPVVADVINTPDLSSFSAFGVEDCYTFHGYALADITQVSLVGGITGQAMSYTSQQFGSWSIVYWIVPVKMDTGGTSFERVVLYVQNSGQGVVVKGLTTAYSVHNIGGSLNASNEADRALINNRTFLVAFADQLLYAQSSPLSDRQCRVKRHHDLTDGHCTCVPWGVRWRFAWPVRPHVRGWAGDIAIRQWRRAVGVVRRHARARRAQTQGATILEDLAALGRRFGRGHLRDVDQRGYRRRVKRERGERWQRQAASGERGPPVRPPRVARPRPRRPLGAVPPPRPPPPAGPRRPRPPPADPRRRHRRVGIDRRRRPQPDPHVSSCCRRSSKATGRARRSRRPSASWNIGWAFRCSPAPAAVHRSRCS